MNPLRILLLSALILVVFSSGEVEAVEPKWSSYIGTAAPIVSSSYDGQTIAAGSDTELFLFDRDSDVPLWSYDLGNEILSLEISGDGQYVAVGTKRGAGDGGVFVFNKLSNQPIWDQSTSQTVDTIAISYDGNKIIAGSIAGTDIRLYDIDDNSPVWTYAVSTGVRTVDISKDGGYLVSGSDDNKVAFFSVESNEPLWNYTTDSSNKQHSNVISVSISNCEYWYYCQIVSLTSDDEYAEINLFKAQDEIPVWTSIISNSYSNIDISNDGNDIVVGDDNKVYLFNNASSTPVWHYRTDAPTNSVAISPEGYDLVAGTIDDYVYVFNKNGSTPLWSYLAVDEIRSVDITNDYVYLGASDGKLYNFDNPINKPDLYCASLSFSNDNPEIGDVVIINATIKVLGVNVTDNFSVGFYLDAIPSENGTEIGFQVVNGIEIGYPYFVSINWTAINGTHTIYAVADSTDVIDESEEKNDNRKTITVGFVEPESNETSETTDTTEETTSETEESDNELETDYTMTIIGAAIVIALSILGAAVILRK